jgi:glycosyltransferase involved in cell wall biosynthesis
MLAEALASVRAQTFTDYEIIVVANGERPEMIRQTRRVAASHGARYYTMPEGNASVARNFGIAAARGEWIALLDDDDLWLPEKLERQLAEAERTGADMVTSDYVEFYPDGREKVRRWRVLDGCSYLEAISHGDWTAGTPTVLARKRAFIALGGFDSTLRYAEDLDMWRRISWAHAIRQVPEILVRVRCGHVQLTDNKRLQDWYDLVHYFKMRRDTPPDLHATLPSAVVFIVPRLVGLIIPQWLRRQLRPRARLAALRHWLRRTGPPWKVRPGEGLR